MTNPYIGLPEHQFWRRAISRVEAHLVDPVVEPRFRISDKARVATAGSCFAQHISRRLLSLGFSYLVVEPGHELSPEERAQRNFGVFSARFGNIYTAAQLKQLYEEAFGLRVFTGTAFQRRDGRWIDALRPLIEPSGFDSEEAVRASRASHLASVRKMFLEADVFVFTLGLTEAWRSTLDGRVFPLAPGVVSPSIDPSLFEFVNFDADDVFEDLSAFIDGVTSINPSLKILLTVSPVPLIATYEPQHVLVSNTYSKAVLRVVAEKAKKAFEAVDYFPSYEIITGNHVPTRYFEDDRREVSELGVDHAMRCFASHYLENVSAKKGDLTARSDRELPNHGSGSLVCDEEMMDSVRF